jgi:hypothetical protein
MNVHTLQVTISHATFQSSIRPSVVVAWLLSSLGVAGLRLLTAEVLHRQPLTAYRLHSPTTNPRLTASTVCSLRSNGQLI